MTRPHAKCLPRHIPLLVDIFQTHVSQVICNELLDVKSSLNKGATDPR